MAVWETPYDSQEDIYKSFFTDLDEAIAELQQYTTNYPGSKPLAKYDLVYGGDFVKAKVCQFAEVASGYAYLLCRRF